MTHKILCPARIALFGQTCTCHYTDDEIALAQVELEEGDTLFND